MPPSSLDLQSFPPVKPEDVRANKFEGTRISCQAPTAYPGKYFTVDTVISNTNLKRSNNCYSNNIYNILIDNILLVNIVLVIIIVLYVDLTEIVYIINPK